MTEPRGTVELAPCPFCGGEARVVADDCVFEVHCRAPLCRGAGPLGDSRAEAIAAWNRRLREPEGRDGTLAWMVAQHDYDSCRHCGFFATEAEAEEYAAELRLCAEEGDDMAPSVVVSPCRTSPRRSKYGAFVVELAPDGSVVDGGWEDYTTPDNNGWDDGESAHWWRNGPDERVVTDRGSVLRAAGINRDEAVARGRALLATAIPSTSNPVASPSPTDTRGTK